MIILKYNQSGSWTVVWIDDLSYIVASITPLLEVYGNVRLSHLLRDTTDDDAGSPVFGRGRVIATLCHFLLSVLS